MDISVDLKQARREMFRVRGRFLKLQRSVIGDALEFSAVPVVEAAKANAPRLRGRLAARIQMLNWKAQKGRPTVEVGPARFGKRDKRFPYWGIMQEKGYWATGRAKRKNAKSPTWQEGKHFLANAGKNNFSRSQTIFAERVFKGLAEIQAAGEAAGLV